MNATDRRINFNTVSVAPTRRSTAVDKASSGVRDCWDSRYVRNDTRSSSCVPAV